MQSLQQQQARQNHLTQPTFAEKFAVLGVESRRVPASFAYRDAMSIELALAGSLSALCGPLAHILTGRPVANGP